MKESSLSLSSSLLLGSLIAHILTGTAGVFFGFLGGLIGSYMAHQVLPHNRALKTDAERVLEGLIKPEDKLLLGGALFIILVLSAYTGVSFYYTLPAHTPIPEIISVNMAFLIFLAGAKYLINKMF